MESAIVAISEKKLPERNTRACPSNVMLAGVSFLLRISILYLCLPQAEIAEIGDNSSKLSLVSSNDWGLSRHSHGNQD